MKEKFIHAHLNAAEVYAKLSTAKRLQVGCVVVKNDTIIGIGYNGMPSGWDNNCELVEKTYDSRDIFGSSNEWNFDSQSQQYTRLKTKPEVLHAESNALAKIAKSTNSSDRASMFITHAPCIECSKLIHQSGITSVYYRKQYRSTDGIDFLKKCGVYIEQVDD